MDIAATGEQVRESDVTPGGLQSAYLELNKEVTAKVDVYVSSATEAKRNFDALLPELDRMQAMLSQRGNLRLRKLMDSANIPTWTEWYDDLNNRLHLDITLRATDWLLGREEASVRITRSRFTGNRVRPGNHSSANQ